MINFLPLALLVLLTSCVLPVKTTSIPSNTKLWQQHLDQMQTIQGWNISGRISVQTSNDGGPADLFWSQTDNQHFDIRMVAPFGGGTMHLQGQPSHVLLTTSDGQSVVAQNADDLLEQVQGWHFPVSGLRYWLLGIPAPTSQAQLISWNEQGLLYVMHQDGWRIELRQYSDVDDKTLPKKLFISRLGDEEVDVRLVIREWKLLNDS